MLFLLSPAKTQIEGAACAHGASAPALQADAAAVAGALARLTPAARRALLGLSPALGAVADARAAAWPRATTAPAVFTFDGPAFRALDAGSLAAPELARLQAALLIVDPLYGALRALDAVAPYRLEMVSRLAVGGAVDLYAFWGDRVAREARARAAAAAAPGTQPTIVNVASAEYARAVLAHAPALGGARVVHVRFPGASAHAKAARGAMVRFAVRTGAARPEDLRAFDGAAGELRFDAGASSEDELVFVRGAAKRAAPAPAPAKVPASAPAPSGGRGGKKRARE
jgi:cytoplasmic iron level regulating protein YaaA (DUF328/UPF0246 family)